MKVISLYLKNAMHSTLGERAYQHTFLIGNLGFEKDKL